MDDRTNDLISKFYREFSRRFDRIGERLSGLEEGQQSLQMMQKRINAMMESDIRSDRKAISEEFNRG